jgi:acetyl-CoA carboxylase beta subunit
LAYLICPSCHLTTYSQTLWQSLAECPKCGRPLDAGPSRGHTNVIPLSSHPRYGAAADDADPTDDCVEPSA